MRISLYAFSAFAIVIAIAFGFPKGTYPLLVPAVAYASTILPSPVIVPLASDVESGFSAATSTPAAAHPTSSPSAKATKAVPSTHTASKKTAATASGTDVRDPARLIIPSLNMNAPIKGVGVNAQGEMAVPSGSTDNVGWYEYGTIPGDMGSAVLDAHVFAEFADLKYLKAGDDIYIATQGGSTLHFVVASTVTYPLNAIDAQMLFNRADARRLNLITCAGNLTPDHSTYDHRLIVYAVLAS